MKTLQLLLTLTSIFGCTHKYADAAKSSNVDTAKIKFMTATETKTYLALGDSYTIGEAEPQDQSFPYQLKRSLKTNENISVQDPTIIAVTGWTTDDLINAIDESKVKLNTYDVVTLLIGVNDQYQGLSQNNYRVKFSQVLQTAIKFAKGDATRVFVLSIPDWGVTPFAEGKDGIIGPQIEEFNTINREESAKAKVNYVDIIYISRKASADLTLVASDGLHPSGKMYHQWIERVQPVVAARLKK